MTELGQMQQEMIQSQNILSFTAIRTKNIFDERMRSTVKELLGYRYALEAKPVEQPPEVRELVWHWENAMKIGDMIFGGNSDIQIQFMKNNANWNRTRPVRIHNYVQKLADIFPPEYLTRLLHSSKNLRAEELINLYEADKGEAKRSDYSGIPTGIDLIQLRIKVTLVHKT